jgi:hypothetical protein
MTDVTRRGGKKAIVALAQRLAVILHRIWIDSSEFHCASRSIQQPPKKGGSLSSAGARAPLAATTDEASSQGTRFRFGRTMFRCSASSF